MLDFMAHDFQIERITSTMCVPPQMRNHVHKNRPYHGLALHIGGNKVYNFVDRAPIPADKTGIIYMPQGSTYDVDILEESPCYAISFALSKSVDFPPFFFEVKNLHAFLSLFKEADDIWIRKPTGYQMKCKALLYSILFQMQKEYEEGNSASAYRQQLLPALEYIHNHYTQNDLTIGTLASACHISEPYFRKLFALCFGTSPLKYINQLRFARAKEMLDSGFYSVGQIAELIGFQSECYFSREFKAQFGISPSQYRKI